MTKFFSNEVKGLNADIKRHSIKIQKMKNLIQELERIPNKNELDKCLIFSYKNMLDILIQSNVSVVSKIGKRS